MSALHGQNTNSPARKPTRRGPPKNTSSTDSSHPKPTLQRAPGKRPFKRTAKLIEAEEASLTRTKRAKHTAWGKVGPTPTPIGARHTTPTFGFDSPHQRIPSSTPSPSITEETSTILVDYQQLPQSQLSSDESQSSYDTIPNSQPEDNTIFNPFAPRSPTPERPCPGDTHTTNPS
ncbi:hypothetical protein A1O3_09764 [Capronia epimyces CBS 606.96]|uniref:Uncharacterized protein n=1 Tax=Capronia epimyces CBS 606.96 TaxID=1182542 RepID=W9XAN9_9EURO|nr:uncharacterized protein A1O3_09764 [Capronia epimyces CBS 606.96]EXJ77537.1 hypothetical protein A1O3_09764 [Capronia epimyces CBS 606.96]